MTAYLQMPDSNGNCCMNCNGYESCECEDTYPSNCRFYYPSRSPIQNMNEILIETVTYYNYPTGNYRHIYGDQGEVIQTITEYANKTYVNTTILEHTTAEILRAEMPCFDSDGVEYYHNNAPTYPWLTRFKTKESFESVSSFSNFSGEGFGRYSGETQELPDEYVYTEKEYMDSDLGGSVWVDMYGTESVLVGAYVRGFIAPQRECGIYNVLTKACRDEIQYLNDYTTDDGFKRVTRTFQATWN